MHGSLEAIHTVIHCFFEHTGFMHYAAVIKHDEVRRTSTTNEHSIIIIIINEFHRDASLKKSSGPLEKQ